MYRSVKTGEKLAEKFANSVKKSMKEKVFETSLDEVDSTIEWYENLLRTITFSNEEEINRAVLVFSELYMNAYEHGNLGIDTKTKKHYLEKENYFEKLYEIEQKCSKKISVKVYKILNKDVQYIATEICDEGKGFDVLKITEDNKNITHPNGRGIFVSRKNCDDVYYNNSGSCVLFLNTIL